MKEKPPKKLECYHGGSLTSRGSKREGAMVRTVVAAYLDVLCVLNLLSSDASLLCGADQDTCHVPLPSLLEEISPSPLLVPISLLAAAAAKGWRGNWLAQGALELMTDESDCAK